MSNEGSKPIDPKKIDALRRHMLLTVASICTIFGTSRVSYYGWLKGTGMRDTTAKRIRDIMRKLVSCVSHYNWPDPAVFVASQAERLIMLQDLLKNLDKEPIQQ